MRQIEPDVTMTGKRFSAALLLGLGLLAPAAVHAQRPQLTPAEQGMLPKYCWARHVDKKYAGMPEYNIPGNCGKFMNHMCPGMIYLTAAQRITDPPRQRRYNAQKALGEFGYTKSHITPECPLRGDLEMGISMAQMLMKTVR